MSWKCSLKPSQLLTAWNMFQLCSWLYELHHCIIESQLWKPESNATLRWFVDGAATDQTVKTFMCVRQLPFWSIKPEHRCVQFPAQHWVYWRNVDVLNVAMLDARLFCKCLQKISWRGALLQEIVVAIIRHSKVPMCMKICIVLRSFYTKQLVLLTVRSHCWIACICQLARWPASG